MSLIIEYDLLPFSPFKNLERTSKRIKRNEQKKLVFHVILIKIHTHTSYKRVFLHTLVYDQRNSIPCFYLQFA